LSQWGRPFRKVSKERAKEPGMEIPSKASGPNAVWVALGFKTEGKLSRSQGLGPKGTLRHGG
jgi:hypothetical protein